MPLFAACTMQEENADILNGDGRVNFSLELPASVASTRAEIQIPADYKMRCILEVWAGEEEPVLKYREERAMAGGISAFDFTLQSGNYTCLFWTDFIAVDAAEEEVVTEDGVVYSHFEDMFYDTKNLQTVTIKDANGTNLFDTDACDAFFAKMELEKSAENVARSVKLTRPLAKLVVKENDEKQFSSLTGLTASYQVPSGFNVLTGEPLSSMKVLNLTKKSIGEKNAEEQVLFTNYVFTPSAGELKMGTIAFQFSLGGTILNREIPAGSFTLMRNQELNVKGALIGEGTFVPEEPTELPQVGDFYYQNGTYSSTYTASVSNPCIGVVFAVTHDGSIVDNPKNYEVNGKAKLEKVRGWVVAAYDVTDKAVGGSGVLKAGVSKEVAIPDGVKKDKGDMGGFKNTELFKEIGKNDDYPALNAILNYGEQVPAPLNSSGWYWGGDEQFRILMTAYANKNDAEPSLAVGRSLAVLAENNAGEILGKGGDMRRYWVSTYCESKGLFYIVCSDPGNSDFSAVEDWCEVTSTRNVRAILTF